ncbi:MAG: alpha/beta fold hydrolase [Candidatus Levybacteria bacterium]|nr:alpha/beta fold hydrolase [Candidatus Levybacteria bacterium]
MEEGEIIDSINPLSIKQLRENDYPGSEIVIGEELENGSNYQRYVASYKSEGLKIYGLLTIPNGQKPEKGWPAIIFNHGYIAPSQYKTTERYVAYLDGFARNGYVVFKPDYRGHGESEGDATGSYGSNSYTIDVLNAVSSVKKLKDVDPSAIGMWGHSMGGFITLRNMVVRKDIKVGVIWAGVVTSYPDLLTRWRRGGPTPSTPQARGWRKLFIEKFGDPQDNPDFWNSISANSYLSDISGPIQLHHGTADESVPVEFSQTLEKQMKEAGKTVELYTYDGDNHNISNSFNIAMQRSIEFFDKYLK